MHAPVLCDPIDAAFRSREMDKQFTKRAVPRYKFPTVRNWEGLEWQRRSLLDCEMQELRSLVVEMYEPEFRTGACREGDVVYVNFDLEGRQLVRQEVRLGVQDRSKVREGVAIGPKKSSRCCGISTVRMSAVK